MTLRRRLPFYGPHGGVRYCDASTIFASFIGARAAPAYRLYCTPPTDELICFDYQFHCLICHAEGGHAARRKQLFILAPIALCHFSNLPIL